MRSSAVATMTSRELNDLRSDLRSEKTTVRKAALKQLSELLQSESFVKMMDANTKRMDAGERGDVNAAWAGVAGSVIQSVQMEIACLEGKKRGADKMVTGILRSLVATAEDARRKKRSGVIAPLRRRAGKLFTHVLKVLQSAPVEFTSDYTQTLKLLLLEPRYCAKVQACTYEGIIGVYKDRLEALLRGEGEGGVEDNNRCAQILLQLLKSCPFDLSPRGLLPDMVTFFGQSLAGMVGEEGRLPIALVTALNMLLLRGGLDLAKDTVLADLHRKTRVFVSRVLRGSIGNREGGGGGSRRLDVDKKLREAVVMFCRLQLVLGALEAVPGATEHMVEVVEQLVTSQAADTISGKMGGGETRRGYGGHSYSIAGGGSCDVDYAVKHPHAAVCNLAADLFVSQCREKGADGRWLRAALFPLSRSASGCNKRRDRDSDGADHDDSAAATRRRRIGSADRGCSITMDVHPMDHEPADLTRVNAMTAATFPWDSRARSPTDVGGTGATTLARLGALVAGAATASWAPVMCAILIRQDAALPPLLLSSWISRLVPVLEALCTSGAASDAGAAPRLAWVMRCLRELCVAGVRRRRLRARPCRGETSVSSSTSVPGSAFDGAGRSLDIPRGDKMTEELGSCEGESTDDSGVSDAGYWTIVRRCLMQWLPTFASNHTLSCEALLLVAAVVSSGVTPTEPLPGTFWRYPLLSTSANDGDGDTAEPPTIVALEVMSMLAGTRDGIVRRKPGWHGSRVAWALLRLKPPPVGDRISFYQRRNGAHDSGHGPVAMAVVTAAVRSILLGTPAAPRSAPPHWVELAKPGTDELALEEEFDALIALSGDTAGLWGAGVAISTAGAVRDDKDGEYTTEEADIGSASINAGTSATALMEGSELLMEALHQATLSSSSHVATVRIATVAIDAAVAVTTAVTSGRVSGGGIDSRTGQWSIHNEEGVLAKAAGAIVTVAASLRDISTMFPVDGEQSQGSAGSLAALNDVPQLADTLSAAAAAGLLDETGIGTLHDAAKDLISAAAAVAAGAIVSLITPMEGGEGEGEADAVANGVDLFDDDLDGDIMRGTQALPQMTQGISGMTQYNTGRSLATQNGSAAAAESLTTEAAAHAAVAALVSFSQPFPAAAAAHMNALLSQVTDRTPWEQSDGEEADETYRVVIKSGAKGVADTAASALCSLGGTDASDEVLHDGSRGASAGCLAKTAIEVLEAALDGPTGDMNDATELQCVWVLSQVSSLAEGLQRRCSDRRRARVPSAAVPDPSAVARREGTRAMDAAAVAVEAAEITALFPRLLALVQHAAGLEDCAVLEAEGVADAERFAPSKLRLPHSRAVFSRAARALTQLNAQYYCPHLSVALTSLLQDSSGVVRRSAGKDVAQMLALSKDSLQPSLLREKVLAMLPLQVSLPSENSTGPPTSAAWGDDSPRGGAIESAAARARAAESAAKIRHAREGEGDDDDGGEEKEGEGAGAADVYGGAVWAASAAACAEETALLALGNLAVSCPAVEARCVFLIVANTAAWRSKRGSSGDGRRGDETRSSSRSDHTAFARDLLTWLALGFGYRSRHRFVAQHSRSMATLWIRAGLPVQALLDMPDLAATDVESAAAAVTAGASRLRASDERDTIAAVTKAKSAAEAARKVLAKSWAPMLLPPAVLAGNIGAVDVLAGLCGEDRGVMLKEHLVPIFAQLYPLSRSTCEARRLEGIAAKAAFQGPLLSQAAACGAAGKDGCIGLEAHYFRKLTDIVSEIVHLASPLELKAAPFNEECELSGAGRGDPIVDFAVQVFDSSGDQATSSVCRDNELAALTPPYLTLTEVLQAGDDLPNVVGKSTKRRSSDGVIGVAAIAAEAESHQWSMWRDDRPFRCVLELHSNLDAAQHPRHRRRVLGGVAVLLKMLGAAALQPATWRYLCHMLLSRVSDLHVGHVAVGLLGSLVERSVGEGDWRDVPGGPDGLAAAAIADALQPITLTLVAAAEAGGRAGSAAARLLCTLISGAGHHDQSPLIRKAAAALTPLPPPASVPSIAQASQIHAEVTRATPMGSRLRALVECVPRLPARLRSRALRDGLQEALMRRKDVIDGGVTAACDAWRLATLAVLAEDEQQMARAGELLAVLGPFAREEDEEEGGKGPAGGGSSVAAASDPSDPSLAASILRELSGLLCDASAATVRAAADQARLVLAAKVSASAMSKHLSPLERSYLSQLAPGTRVSPDEAEADALQRAPTFFASSVSMSTESVALDSPSLWMPTAMGLFYGDDKPGGGAGVRPAITDQVTHNSWLCRVTHALLVHCKSPLLRLSMATAAWHAPLAEVLLPAALVDLSMHHSEDSRIHRAVSAGVAACLASNGGGCERVTRTMLAALDAMRARRAAALQRPGAVVGGSSRGGRSSVRASQGSPKPPEGWTRVYWVDVDYLEAADAALRARIPLTAALLVEAWLEDRHGTVSLDNADARKTVSTSMVSDDEVPRHIRLLLEAQAGLSEPDGIYGLLRSHALHIQLRLYEHEGAWGQALIGHDLLMRHASAGTSSGGIGGMEGSRARLMHTLRNMGCLHLLDVYVRSLPAAEVTAPEVAEVHFEAAWRAGQWDLSTFDTAAYGARTLAVPEVKGDMSMATANDFSGGFHRGIYAALTALRAGNAGGAAASLDPIRSDLVRQAVLEGAEAEDVACASIIRLRMIDEIADAARLWNAFRSAHSSSVSRASSNADDSFRAAWRRRISNLSSRSYRLSEPLLALHGAILRELGDNEGFAAHLAEAASLARKAGHAAEGLRSVHQLRVLASGTGGGGSVPERPRVDKEDPDGWGVQPMASPLARWRLEEVKLLWASGRSQMAMDLGKHLMESIGPGVREALVTAGGIPADQAGGNPFVSTQSGGSQPASITLQDPRMFETLSLVSTWQAATRTESSRTILAQHIGAVHSMTRVHHALRKEEKKLSHGATLSAEKTIKLIGRLQFRLAQYSDALYTQSEERLSSPEWAQSEKLRARNEEELVTIQKERDAVKKRLQREKNSLTRDEAIALEEQSRMLHRRIFPLNKQVQLDREETQQLLSERAKWLLLSLQAYRRCLEAGTGSSTRNDQRAIFRIVAIWFNVCGGGDGSSMRGNGADNLALLSQVNSELEKLVTRTTVPSLKFLVLSYQICGRLGTAPQEGNTFPAVLRQLVDRMAAEHPYHTLYHLHALKRGDQVAGSGHHYSMPQEKIHAATDVLDCYRRHSAHCAERLNQMDRMIDAYIQLARHHVDAGRGGAGGYQIPSECKKRALNRLNLVPIITANLPVDPTMRYKEGTFPSFNFFGDTCRLVGGINQPKLVEAHADDGQVYRQLAKAGNDDLRQDAVMQQLFGVCNRLLVEDQATRVRHLKVGTYRVVPLTPAAGVLEWVDNTTLLSEYLLGNNGVIKGAHERYRPKDWKSRECRDKLGNCQTREQLRATYDAIEANFKPVMHHFFLENFPTPQTWYERRLAYTRSVAVNSMVGYIIGLGDRHSSNILLDQASAEMIHIDLGVAFEQGKCLKTPEQVPFRMTRDIVDGMGATGVEGVMRRCCEETLRVLRANKDALSTIVAVLIHDPILKWAVSPERANQRQCDDVNDGGVAVGVGGGEGNLDAERALMRVEQKLDGYEGSELRSVEGQVQQLLQDAQDPEKLCAMYPGWAPWV